jgi:hypothetical protein
VPLGVGNPYARDRWQAADDLAKRLATVRARPDGAIVHADEERVRFLWVAGCCARRRFEMAR